MRLSSQHSKRARHPVARRLGCEGGGDSQLLSAQGLCFRSGHIAVADDCFHRVSVFTADVRHVSVSVVQGPEGVAPSSDLDELVVADVCSGCLRLFSVTGDLLACVGEGRFSVVVVHGSGVFAVDMRAHRVRV